MIIGPNDQEQIVTSDDRHRLRPDTAASDEVEEDPDFRIQPVKGKRACLVSRHCSETILKAIAVEVYVDTIEILVANLYSVIRLIVRVDTGRRSPTGARRQNDRDRDQ